MNPAAGNIQTSLIENCMFRHAAAGNIHLAAAVHGRIKSHAAAGDIHLAAAVHTLIVHSITAGDNYHVFVDNTEIQISIFPGQYVSSAATVKRRFCRYCSKNCTGIVFDCNCTVEVIGSTGKFICSFRLIGWNGDRISGGAGNASKIIDEITIICISII